MNLKKKFIINIFYAFFSQAISLLASLLMSLIIPRYLSVTDYAYWQLFSFYSNYICITQFGIVDGIYLTMGGKKYEELDCDSLKAQHIIFSVFEMMISILMIIVALFQVGISAKLFIFVSLAVYNVIYNMSRFLGFLFQAVNYTKWFSVATIIDRTVILILCIGSILIKQIKWEYFVIIYILGMLISLIYTYVKGKNIFLSKNKIDLKSTIYKLFENAKIGIFLMLSNLASNLILGIGRQGIELRWGLKSFGTISFALSMVSFILVFINQTSLVLFPTIKNINKDKCLKIYNSLDLIFSLAGPVIYIAYLPVTLLLQIWLPQYKESLFYLMVLMPICIFDGKMQLLYNTFFKAFRKERLLLYINLVTVILSIGLCGISICILNSLEAVVYSMLASVIFRTMISDILMHRLFHMNHFHYIYLDILFVIIYICLNLTMTPIYVEISLLIVFCVAIFFNYKELKKDVNCVFWQK